MKIDKYIEEAVTVGDKNGIESLSELQKNIYIIAEAEISCDMDGIDSFIEKYNKKGVLEASVAYSLIGAIDIAKGLKEIAKALPNPSETVLERTNSFITERYNYSYESIKNYVAKNI